MPGPPAAPGSQGAPAAQGAPPAPGCISINVAEATLMIFYLDNQTFGGLDTLSVILCFQ